MDSVYVCQQQTDVEYLMHVELREEKDFRFRMKDKNIQPTVQYRMSKETNNSFFAHFYLTPASHEIACF